MKNQFSKDQTPKETIFDLEDRTARFAEIFIDLAKRLPQNSINKVLVEQCLRSIGSVGANYCEANEAESRVDFVHKLGICKKEAKESKHWIRLIAKANPEFKEELRKLWKEAEELLLIFSTIKRNAERNKKGDK